MASIEWKSEYSVGVTLFDEHHKQLIKIINELQQAIIDGVAEKKCQLLFSKLVEYGQYHFDSEETLLERIHYPAIQDQKHAHTDFITTIKNFRSDHQACTPNVEASLFEYLNKWMIHHILHDDMKYAAYAKSKNIT